LFSSIMRGIDSRGGSPRQNSKLESTPPTMEASADSYCQKARILFNQSELIVINYPGFASTRSNTSRFSESTRLTFASSGSNEPEAFLHFPGMFIGAPVGAIAMAGPWPSGASGHHANQAHGA